MKPSEEDHADGSSHLGFQQACSRPGSLPRALDQSVSLYVVSSLSPVQLNLRLAFLQGRRERVLTEQLASGGAGSVSVHANPGAGGTVRQ